MLVYICSQMAMAAFGDGDGDGEDSEVSEVSVVDGCLGTDNVEDRSVQTV